MAQVKQAVWTADLFKWSLSGLFFCVAMLAQPLFAADMPCVKEVCIGDDLNKLRGIKFQPINSARLERVSKRRMIERAEMYGYQNTDLPAYLALGEFDESVLTEMEKIKAACHPRNLLEATYISDSGYKTGVQVGLWPDKSGNMKWLVMGVSRAYKGIDSSSERDQLVQDLHEKYAQWDTSKVGQPKPGQAGMMLVPVRAPLMTLFLAPTIEAIQVENYKKNPQCKPAKKISLD